MGRSRGGREGLTTRDSWRDLGAPAASNLARGQEDGDRDRVLGGRRQAASRLARLLGISSRSSRESINNALGEDLAPAGQPDFIGRCLVNGLLLPVISGKLSRSITS